MRNDFQIVFYNPFIFFGLRIVVDRFSVLEIKFGKCWLLLLALTDTLTPKSPPPPPQPIPPPTHRAGIFKQSMGARNRVHSLAELVL